MSLYTIRIFSSLWIFSQFFSYVHSQENLSNYSLRAEWLKLLYYQKVNNTLKGEVASDSFYLHPEGKYNPTKELNYSISLINSQQGNKPLDFSCLFPARASLIHQWKLAKVKSNCPKLNSWKQHIDLKSIHYIYTSQYPSNPASVFGHSFILLKSHSQPELMNLTVNYAADVPQKIGPFDYILRGLGGGFDGTYTIQPFYSRIQQYNNVEDRDMWSYQLDFNSQEMDQFLNHLWEIKDRFKMPYHFLTKNCSGILLKLIAAIKTEHSLYPKNPLYIAPAESLKNLNEWGIIKSYQFYPSTGKKLKYYLSKMSRKQKNTFASSFSKRILQSEATKDPLVLSAILYNLEIKRHQNHGTLEDIDKVYRTKVLIHRSKLSKFKEIDHPSPPPTILSHDPIKLSFGHLRNNSLQSYKLSFRPALHEINDRTYSYIPFSEIIFLDTNLLYNSHHGLQLDDLTFFKFANLRAASLTNTPVSFAFNSGLKSNSIMNLNGQYYSYLTPEAGISFNFFNNFNISTHLYTSLLFGNTEKISSFEVGPKLSIIYNNNIIGFSFSYSHSLLSKYQDQLIKSKLSYNFAQNYSVSAQFRLYQRKRSSHYQESTFDISTFF